MKILSRRAHGLADYAMVVALLSLPLALGLTGAPRALAYSFAFFHLLVTAFSKFPPGALAFFSFRVHAAVELVAAIFLIVSPWLLGFSDIARARNSFLILGAALLVMAVATDFERRRAVVPPPPGDRRRWYSRRIR